MGELQVLALLQAKAANEYGCKCAIWALGLLYMTCMQCLQYKAVVVNRITLSDRRYVGLLFIDLILYWLASWIKLTC